MRLEIAVLLLLCLVCGVLGQDENVLLFSVSSSGSARTITPSSGYVVSNPYAPPLPQSLAAPNFVSQLAIDPVGKLGFAPQSLQAASESFFLAVYNLDWNRQAANNTLKTTYRLPWTSQSSWFNVFWESVAGVVLIGNAVDNASPYQLFSVLPTSGALTQLFQWPVTDRFQGGAGAYNQTARHVYLVQTAPGLAIATLDLKTMENSSVPIGTTTSVHSVTILGMGLAFNALHTVYTVGDDSTGPMVTSAHYGLLNPRTGLLTSIAQLDDSIIPSAASSATPIVTTSEGTNELFIISNSASTSRLSVIQLFTGRPVRVVDLYGTSSASFYAAGAVSTTPSPIVSFSASGIAAQGGGVNVLPLIDGWLATEQRALAKFSADGTPLWAMPYAGFLSNTGTAVANKGQTVFIGSSPITTTGPSLLNVAQVEGSSPPSLLNISNDYTPPSGYSTSYFPPTVTAAVSQSYALFSNNIGVFPSDCGNFCIGSSVASFAFCSAQLACTTTVINGSLFAQAVSGNAQYFFVGTNSNILVYAAFPQPTLLTSWNPLSIGNDALPLAAAASESGGLAVFGFSTGLLVFLTNDGSGSFKVNPLPGAPWTARAVACSETAVVAAFVSTSSEQYNISFYQTGSSGAVPKLVATYTPFPGLLRKDFISTPTTVAITSDGKYAIVGGAASLGSNFWIFDLNTIDAGRGTIDPPVSGFLPGAIQRLSLSDRLGRLGVATTSTTGTSYAFGFDI